MICCVCSSNFGTSKSFFRHSVSHFFWLIAVVNCEYGSLVRNRESHRLHSLFHTFSQLSFAIVSDRFEQETFLHVMCFFSVDGKYRFYIFIEFDFFSLFSCLSIALSHVLLWIKLTKVSLLTFSFCAQIRACTCGFLPMKWSKTHFVSYCVKNSFIRIKSFYK